jgi:hypothetical protein
VFVQEEDIQAAVEVLNAEALNKQCLLNVEYKTGGLEFATLCHADTKDDVGQVLITDGWVLAEARREKRLAKLVAQYQKAAEKAKEGRVSNHLSVLTSFYFIFQTTCSILSKIVSLPCYTFNRSLNVTQSNVPMHWENRLGCVIVYKSSGNVCQISKLANSFDMPALIMQWLSCKGVCS